MCFITVMENKLVHLYRVAMQKDELLGGIYIFCKYSM